MDRIENILKRNKGQKFSNFDKNNKSIDPRKKQNAGGGGNQDSLQLIIKKQR